jgi:membrane-associated phospholipid phosphatase/tRNA A-37 threonylcarbamoyl transferase component Bud32
MAGKSGGTSLATRWLPVGYARHPGDALRLVLGVLILLATSMAIHADRVGAREASLERLINGLALPSWTDPGVWLVMQLGVIGAVPLVAALALALRRLRLALDAVLAAGSIYLIAKLVKEFVQRGRPQTLLDGISILGEPARGLGYVSGHSAVAVALATVASPYLGRRGRRVAWALAAAVCVARVYVGAHLPLDVVGGAALGWAAGGLTHLILGAPDGRPSTKRVRKALAEHGLDAGDLEPVGTDFRNSSTYVTAGDDGLFVKAVPREWRDTDLLYRAWRAVARRRSPRLRFALPLHKVEHEASMVLLAAAAGVRAPKVLMVREFGYGAGLLVERRIHGRALADLDPGEVDDALLGETWRQVSLLHQAGFAHGDLVPANVMVDDRGQPWLVDFDQSVHAGEELQALDVGSLLAALTRMVGPDRARAAAEAALGRDALETPTPKSRPVPA